MLLVPICSGSIEPAPITTIDEYIEAYEQVSDMEKKGQLLYDLIEGVERGRIAVDLAESERLTLFLFQVTQDSELRHSRSIAWMFLTKNPHPVLADLAYDCLSNGQDKAENRNFDPALAILVRIRDERAMPFLLDRLDEPRRHGHRSTIRKLAALGDPRALEPLRSIADDDSLTRKFETLIRADDRDRGKETSRVERRAATLANEECENARRAIRDINLLQEKNLRSSFSLDDYAHEMLARNGFVILPKQKNEMFEFYGAQYPYITTDIIFHTFMVMVRVAFDKVESLVLRERVGTFARDMALGCIEQTDVLGDSRWQDHRNRNAAIFAVPAILCKVSSVEEFELPTQWRDMVSREIDRIYACIGVMSSPVLGYDEDYSEYIPRGRHSAKPELAGYFKAMTWLGRAMFPVNSEEATEQALLLLEILEREPGLIKQWEQLDVLLGLFFGERDDLAFPDYQRAARRVVQQEPGGVGTHLSRGILADPKLGESFRAELEKHPLPRVNTAYIEWPKSIQWPESIEWKYRTQGLRILGQRYTRDAHLFQQLLDVGLWPLSGLHIAAKLLDSQRANEILPDVEYLIIGDFPQLPQPPEDRLTSLSEGHLFCFESLLEPEPGIPAFMLRPAWEERLINSALGGWAEVKHATALYTKAAHQYMGISGMTDSFHGYVDPYPQFYTRLDSLVRRMESCLDSCGYFDAIATDLQMVHDELEREYGPKDQYGRYRPKRGQDGREVYRRTLQTMRLDRDQLSEFSDILRHLEAIARKGLSGSPQNIVDGLFLKNLGRRLRFLTFNRSSMNLAEEPMSIIIDAATEYWLGECLEVGVGRPLEIYVAVPDGDRSFVCKGAVYTYYEFTWPVAHRLNDKQWQVMSHGFGGMGTPPWIATRPELGIARDLSATEMQYLKKHALDEGYGDFARIPWRIDYDRNTVHTFFGAGINKEQLGELLELANQNITNPGIKVSVFERLAAFAEEPEVFEFLQSLAQSYVREQRTEFDPIKMYYLIVGLGNAGPEAMPDLINLQSQMVEHPLYSGNDDRSIKGRRYFQTLIDLAIIKAGDG